MFTFPADAPAQFYAEIGGWWKLTVAGRTVDAVKFLALGAGLPALAAVAARRPGGAAARLMILVALAGFAATALTEPTWRQYLLPGFPPLFVLLALAWSERPPGRAERIAFALFVAAGLAPTIKGASRGVAMARATSDGAAIRAALDRARVTDPVFTMAPQILAAAGRAPDPRIAAGPFYFRSHGLIDAAREDRWRLLSADRLAAVPPPAVILIDATARGGDAPLNARLEAFALAHGYAGVPLASPRWRLYRRP